MNVKDILLEYLKTKDGAAYAYISKSVVNLNAVKQHAMEGCDLSKTTTKVVLVQPIGINQIVGELDGVYVDKDATTDEHVRKFVTLKPEGILVWVNPETMECE